jgi:CHASE2 domain-containing sensor protein
MGVVPGRVPGPGITNTPAPVQGRPVNEFLPNGSASVVVLGAGETGTGGSWVTVFPLSIGLVVLPLRNGLLVFCASAIVVVAVKPRTLRPISAMRCNAMSDLPVVAQRR